MLMLIKYGYKKEMKRQLITRQWCIADFTPCMPNCRSVVLASAVFYDKTQPMRYIIIIKFA